MAFIRRCEDKYLNIGKNADIDPLAVIGEMTVREIENKTLKIGKNAIIRSGSIIYAGTSIGDNFNTGHYVIVREKNSIALPPF